MTTAIWRQKLRATFCTATGILLFTLLITNCRAVATPANAAESCASAPLTESQQAEVARAARAVAERVLVESNKIDFRAALRDYSPDADARYVENGVVFPSLAALQKEYDALGPALEVLENTADAWSVTVLGPDAAVVTVPIHLRIKMKGGVELRNHPYVWSAVVQRRAGRWLLVQTHESHVRYDELVTALTPRPPK